MVARPDHATTSSQSDTIEDEKSNQKEIVKKEVPDYKAVNKDPVNLCPRSKVMKLLAGIRSQFLGRVTCTRLSQILNDEKIALLSIYSE